MADLRYPIGKFEIPKGWASADRASWIEAVEQCPSDMRRAVAGLTDAQLDTPYRPEGWTLRQVVHHLADSHMNCYIRFKLALTEDNPTIKPYDEQAWALLPEAKSGPIEMSLALVDTIHTRWTIVLRNMTDADFKRTFDHPARRNEGPIPLGLALAHYSWHGRHHVAHVTSLRERMRW